MNALRRIDRTEANGLLEELPRTGNERILERIFAAHDLVQFGGDGILAHVVVEQMQLGENVISVVGRAAHGDLACEPASKKASR